MTPKECLIGVQTKLARAGFYKGKIDGIHGPLTEAAWEALKRALSEPVIDNAVDARSEANIKTLHPKAQPLARALLHKAAENGITMVVTSGTRTYEEQDELYAQGRTKPGAIVTNARAGYSNHNFGIAFDLTEFVSGQPVWESPRYAVVGALGKSLGLSWGGDWRSIQDEPHFELRPDWAEDLTETQMITGLRDRHARGVDVFA